MTKAAREIAVKVLDGIANSGCGPADEMWPPIVEQIITEALDQARAEAAAAMKADCARVAEGWKPKPKERPTIEELEAILNAPEAPNVSINHDGSITTGPTINEEIAAAIRALPPPASAWQPIETAPKDGTHILACDINAIGQAIVWWGPRDGVQHWMMNHMHYLHPTHWRPLPDKISAPPEGGGDGD